jgi:hypothetical protein
MTTADEYRRLAEQCMGWVREAQTDAERTMFCLMARDWNEAAAKQNGGGVPVVRPNQTDSECSQ